MTSQFLGREIKVTTGGELKEPVSFRLGDREYHIAEIAEVWHDHGFGAASPYRKRWWQRHHRNYYKVKTTGGEVFEIYHDRGTKLEQARQGKCFVHRQL